MADSSKRQRVDASESKSSSASAASSTSLTFSLMTYNLWKTAGKPTAFAIRRPVLLRAIRKLDPDVLFTQELHPLLTDTVTEALPAHAHVEPSVEEAESLPGWAREGNIFWRQSIFEEVEHGAVDIGQQEPERRLFWVRLQPVGQAVEDGATPPSVLFATAHFTWQGSGAECMSDVNLRKEQARRTAKALCGIRRDDNECIFFGGDLNES